MAQDNIEYPSETIKIKDSFEDYAKQKRHLNSFRSLDPKKKKLVKVDSILYKKIIRRFLTIYVYDLLYLNHSIYFFFCGKMEKIKVGGVFGGRNYAGVEKQKPKSVGFFWFKRPYFKFNGYVITKARGSFSPMMKLTQEYRDNHDVDELITIKQAYKKHLNY